MHGLEREWHAKVQFLYVDFRSPLGKELGSRYGVDHLPALVLIDSEGQVRKKLGMGLHLRDEAETELGKIDSGLAA